MTSKFIFAYNRPYQCHRNNGPITGPQWRAKPHLIIEKNPAGRDHAAPVNERIAALKGHSRSDLVGDAERKGGSPLGYGGGKRRG